MSETITKDEIRERMVDMVARALQTSPQEIRCDILFSKLGVDSMAVVDMAGQLEKWLRMEIEPTAVWDYPTIDAMAAHLEGQCLARASSS